MRPLTTYEHSRASSVPEAARSDLPAQGVADGDSTIRVTRDLIYAHAQICIDDPAGPIERALRLDKYEPADDKGRSDRPALLLAFGGAFHRGSKEDDTFATEEGLRNTSIAEYCRRFAKMGYVACSIDYRLVQEAPHPGSTLVVADPTAIPRSRVDHVREFLGLPPATAQQLWRGIEAASDDMAAAFRFLRKHATEWRIDPARIAVGGFSAGARTALNAAFGERIEAAAVISLSGYMDVDDLGRHLDGARTPDSRPPVLLICADRDLDYIREGTPPMLARMKKAGVQCEMFHVPDAGHFYPADALVRGPDDELSSLDQVLIGFLDRHLERSPDAR